MEVSCLVIFPFHFPFVVLFVWLNFTLFGRPSPWASIKQIALKCFYKMKIISLKAARVKTQPASQDQLRLFDDSCV